MTTIIKSKKIILIGDTTFELIKTIENTVINNFIPFKMSTNSSVISQTTRIRNLMHLNHKTANLLNK